ncbi:hypothetical protein DL95DRAFT_527648 [Leptodontidium sp. 2 PMI_412]|nr:hypothetical protein DL95DRAFT_527648 [Leptodontidium sp. 2 PMI_412]
MTKTPRDYMVAPSRRGIAPSSVFLAARETFIPNTSLLLASSPSFLFVAASISSVNTGGPNIMSSRLSHVKSRNGCLQCKRRKIKCDEKAPRCSPCTKHRVSCSFTDLVGKPPPSTSLPRAAPILPSQLLDLELLHHFTISTADTLSDRPVVQQLFQSTVISEALKYEYLMHSILSVSAFHLTTIRCPSSKSTYLAAAHAHFNTAVQLFREILMGDITPTNCHSVVICASMIFVASCARPRDDYLTSTAGLTFSRVLEWLTLVRGVAAVSSTSWEWMCTGPFARMVPTTYDEDDKKGEASSEACESHFDGLLRFFSQTVVPHEYETYRETLGLLRTSFAALPIVEVRSVFLWPAHMPKAFFNLLTAQTPEALVVLAYYCVFLYKNDSRWFVRGWPEYIVKVIESDLDGKLARWMRWPLETMGMQTPEKLAQHSLTVRGRETQPSTSEV